HRDFFLGASFCHDLKDVERQGRRVLLGDPMEVALVDMARRAVGPAPASARLDEVPFDADRMRHSVVQDTGDGPVLYCKGAPEAVLGICREILDDGRPRALDAAT